VSIDIDTDSLNKNVSIMYQLSCKFFDEERDTWNVRGVYLRGIDFYPTSEKCNRIGPEGSESVDEPEDLGQKCASAGLSGVGVTAICVSSHLTMFAVVDDSEAKEAVDAQARRKRCLRASIIYMCGSVRRRACVRACLCGRAGARCAQTEAGGGGGGRAGVCNCMPAMCGPRRGLPS
jgi:hypothetical protein